MPELPDWRVPLVKGLKGFSREIAVATTRSFYGCIARWRLGSKKAEVGTRVSGHGAHG